jgi:hypothetical protein
MGHLRALAGCSYSADHAEEAHVHKIKIAGRAAVKIERTWS